MYHYWSVKYVREFLLDRQAKRGGVVFLFGNFIMRVATTATNAAASDNV